MTDKELEEAAIVVPIKFLKSEIERLKLYNRGAYEEGDFDNYNWEKQGWYKAFEYLINNFKEWQASQNTQKELDAIELLKEYESWEADLIADNEMWWPYVDKDRISGKTYDKMIELQAKRNEILYPEKYLKKYVCRLDEQQCREECEHRNTDIEKCPFVTIKVEQPQEGK